MGRNDKSDPNHFYEEHRFLRTNNNIQIRCIRTTSIMNLNFQNNISLQAKAPDPLEFNRVSFLKYNNTNLGDYKIK